MPQPHRNNTTTTGPTTEDGWFHRLLCLLALVGFAIVEPLLTSFGATPAAFIFHDVESPGWFLLFGLAVALLPAVALWVLCLAAHLLWQPLGLWMYRAAILLLAAAWGVQLAKWGLGLHSAPQIALVAGVIGLVVLALYLRNATTRSLLQIAAAGPLVFLGLFLFMSDAGKEFTFREAVDDIEKINADLPSVVFILLDELPTKGLLDAQAEIEEARFPNLAAFADVATWYRRYTIAHAKTDYSVPALLSGRHPQSVAPTYSNHPGTLFSLLAPTHHLTVFESITELCGFPACGRSAPGVLPDDLEPQFTRLVTLAYSLWLRRISLTDYGGEGVGDFQESLATAVANPNGASSADARSSVPLSPDAKIPRRVEKFLSTLIKGEPTLYFLHVQLPHVPWRFYPDGTTYEMPYAKADFEQTNHGGERWVGRVKEFRFLMQMQYTDALVGKIFSRLKARELFDDSLIVVTSDHGRSFKPTGPIRALLPTTVDAVAYAPLLIKLPGQQRGEISDINVQAYDLLPTIAENLGISVPWQTDGLPASGPGIGARGDEKLAFFRGKENPVGDEYRFSDAENYPRFATRGIGELREATRPLDLLNQHLGLDQYLGKKVSDFQIEDGGQASVINLAKLLRPDPDDPIGAVMGQVESETAASHLLVAVDGEFVSGSPLMLYRKIERSFYALLPQETVRRNKNIALYLVGDTLQKLSLTESG